MANWFGTPKSGSKGHGFIIFVAGEVAEKVRVPYGESVASAKEVVIQRWRAKSPKGSVIYAKDVR